MAAIGNGAGSIRRIELDYRSHASPASLLIMLCRSWKALQVIAVHDKTVSYTKQYDCNLYNAKNKGQNVSVPTVSPCNSKAIRQKCSIVTNNKTEHGQVRLRVPAAQNSSRRPSQRHDPIDRLGMCCAGIRVACVFLTHKLPHTHARTHTHTHKM